MVAAPNQVAHPVDSAGRFASLNFDEVETGILYADEAFDLQVVEVPETRGVEVEVEVEVEVGDVADVLHFEAGVGALSEVESLVEVEILSEVEILAEVESLAFAVERRPHW